MVFYMHLHCTRIYPCKESIKTARDQHRAFEPSTSQVVSDPAVVRTELVADRWLRSTFDLPVQAGGMGKWGWVVAQLGTEQGVSPWENDG